MSGLLAKIGTAAAAKAVEKPDESFGMVVKVILCIAAFLVLLFILVFEMIGTFAAGDKVINDEFDITQEQLYQDIEKTYFEYKEELQKKMDTREAEIIAENTVTVTNEEGVEESVCNVTVSKQIKDVNYAYIFSYINHKHPIKEGETYQFDKKEIKELLEKIAPFKEIKTDTHYTLYTDLKSPEKVAELCFTEEDERQMYAVSYELYASFLDFANANSADSDTGEGNTASPGSHYTYISAAQENTVINNCTDDIGKKVVEFALSKLGSPYSQAKRHDGIHFDCSSLCYYAYKSAGIDISYGSASTAAAIGNYCVANNQTVSYEQLQPGDLIFYCCTPGNGRFMGIDHVAIYAGDGKIIDASSSKGYVVYRNVFWKDRIVLCGRPR